MDHVHTDSTSKVLPLRHQSEELRLTIIDLHARAGSGHLGSSLSIVEILVVLFQRYFRWEAATENKGQGDRFVLSKGHAALALYCLLGLSGRIMPERLADFGKNGSGLEPHPNERLEPEIHASTGSLGQGLSIGVGLALGSRLQGTDDRAFVLIGDGEANEGQIWEAARCASVLRLSNLIVILDDNGMQQDGPTSEIMAVPDLVDSWRAMGWYCAGADGHDCASLDAAFEALLTESREGPRLLHARTVKGRGIPFLEGCTESHYPPPLSSDELALVKYLLRVDRSDG
jgi:transketolase